MKKLIVIGLVMFTANSFATTRSDCDAIADYASALMEGRQVGVSMSESFTIAGDSKFLQNMVIRAYEQPAYSTEKYQDRAVKKFTDEYFLACIKSIKS